MLDTQAVRPGHDDRSGGSSSDVGLGPVLLGPYAARTCPVKTQNSFDPRIRPGPLPDAGQEWRDRARRFVDGVLDDWSLRPGVVDLRRLGSDAEEATASALRRGARVVLAAALPSDPLGHRRGGVDALVRGRDRADGGMAYHPVIVKGHKVLVPARPPRPEGSDRPDRRPAGGSALSDPGRRTVLVGHELRVARAGDLLQLAHVHRLLQAAGLAADGPALGALIGTDQLPAGPSLVWADLDVPLLRTPSSHPDGWQIRSVLDCYDHELALRVEVAERAQRQTDGDTGAPSLLLRPIRNRECDRCPWWDHCRPQLHPDDISLRIDKGALDPREIVTLRGLGVETVSDLADADLDRLAPRYLPQVAHRSTADERLRTAARRARMLVSRRRFERETSGPIEVPAAAVEVDFDLESSASGRVYLWGFLVDDGSGIPRKHQVAHFGDLDDETEIALARDALAWLRDLVTRREDVRVYHYSAYETAMLDQLRQHSGDPVLAWATTFATTGFVDLLEIVQRHFFGLDGLGLKTIADEAGFRWRDPDPGGLNSQRWFEDAVHADDPDVRAAARRRVLAYNEDDVRATHRLRAWLRER